MLDNHEFHGKAAVNERGQIVLPVNVRKKCGIAPGDSLFVFTIEKKGEALISLIKEESFKSLMMEFEQRMYNLVSGNGDAKKRKIKKALGKKDDEATHER